MSDYSFPLQKLATLVCFLWLTALCCPAQTVKIEQIKDKIETADNPQDRLLALLSLTDHRQSLSSEALRHYAFEARKLSQQTGSLLQKALAEYFVATYYVKEGQLDSALFLCQLNLQQLQKKNMVNTPAWLKFSVLKAHVFVKDNRYKEAIATYYNTLSVAERSTDTLMQMVAKNGIGWVNMEMEQHEEALKWFHRALATTADGRLHQRCANIYGNMAAVYTALNRFDSADYYVKKSIAFATADQNLFFLSNALNILADNYIRQQKPAKAEAPLKEAAKIRAQTGDPFYIVSDLSQLALFYAGEGQPQKGIEASTRGIAIAREYNLQSKLPYLYFALAKNYRAAGNYRSYGETMEKILALKDSVYQQNSEKELAEIRARYNQQKQENLIIQQELALSKKNMVIYGVLIVVFFGIVISLLLFSSYRRKQRQLVEKLKEEEKRKLEEAVMIAEEAERRRISADLHDNLGAYATAIFSNADELLVADGKTNESVLQTIKNNADDILNSLNETIWVLNKSAIPLTSLCDRFKNYVAKISSSYPEFLININESIATDTSLSPEAALNILRIMQEAFHNAIRHSRGDSISVDISGGSAITISIADNGEGMVKSKKIGGHGISNMEKRARANDWQLLIQSEAHKGTVVKLIA